MPMNKRDYTPHPVQGPGQSGVGHYQTGRLPTVDLPLVPPFSASKSLVGRSQLVVPAAVQDGRNRQLVIPERDMARFLSGELRTLKLDKLHDYLWLAGLPLPARTLQRQRMMGRTIHLTERPDEHMVWYQTKLLLKPLPDFLLCHAFWEEYLCSDVALHRSAAGLLLSYLWLVGRRGDFVLARSAGLIPDEVDWPQWNEFMNDFLGSIDPGTLARVDRRYHYGELRLSRLNSMTRFLPSMWSRENFVWGYLSTSTWRQAFFERNFSWLLSAFVCISVIMSAMEVGLATQRLNGNLPFENLSYGAALLAIAVVFLGAGLVWLVWFMLFCHHLLSAMHLDRTIRTGRNGTLDKA